MYYIYTLIILAREISSPLNFPFCWGYTTELGKGLGEECFPQL